MDLSTATSDAPKHKLPAFLRPAHQPQTDDERRAHAMLTRQGGYQPYGYTNGSQCARCGGTDTGESHRGYVGKCGCGSAS